MLNSPCNAGQCIWRDDLDLPYCIPPETSVVVRDESEESSQGIDTLPRCGFAVDIGAKCPTIAHEGQRFCSSSCKEIVSPTCLVKCCLSCIVLIARGQVKCTRGIMVIDQRCGTSCETDDQKEFGKGASCIRESCVHTSSSRQGKSFLGLWSH